MNAKKVMQRQRTNLREIRVGFRRGFNASFPRSLSILESTTLRVEKNDAKSVAEKGLARVTFQIQRGRNFCNDNNFARALACFDRAIELNPTDAFAHLFRGWALVQLDRAGEALAAFDTALGIDPNNSETFFMHGVLLAQSERFEEALVSFDTAIRLAPGDPAGYFGRGWALDALGGHFEEALDAFNAAVRLDTDGALIVHALVHRSVLLKKLPRFWASEKSDEDYLEACRLAPDVASGLMIELVEQFKRRRAASGEDEAAWNERVWREAGAIDEAYARKGVALARNHPIEIADKFQIENRDTNRDNLLKTGKTGAKDEGLVQEPQTQIDTANTAARFGATAAEVESARPPDKRLSPGQLKAFLAHAAANPWDSDSGVAPSAHIKTTFKKWLGRGLWREHIVKAQPNLAGAYAAEVSRDPGKRVEGLAVRPHKKPAGSPRPLSVRLVAELSEPERELKREAERMRKKRWRQKTASADV
jgi:tetratricopeptide (TPR) repeat protein